MSLSVSVAKIIEEAVNPVLAIHPSWQRVLLDNVARILNGYAFESKYFNKDKGVPLVRIRDVGKSTTECRYHGVYDDIYLIKPGDFLVAMDGDFKCARAQGTALLNQRVCKVSVTSNGYHPRFLEYALPGYLAAIGERTSSQTVKHLSSSSVAEIPLPLPPFAEQKRIVEKIDACLPHVKSAREHLSRIPAMLKRFRQAVLTAACSGRLTENWREANHCSLEDWHAAELSDICASISDGDHQPPPKQAKGVPFLTIGNVSSGRLDFSETRFVPEAYFRQIKPERKPTRGDVLYTVVGATIGIPVLVEIDRPFCFQRHIALLRVSKEITPEFLWTLMSSPEVLKESWSRVTGSAQPTLPLGNLRTIPISVPPLTEQNEIVRRVHALLELASSIKETLSTVTMKTEKLTQSLLAKAFRGELVHTEAALARREGREYEPASVLLERIKQQRASQVKSTSNRKSNVRKASAHV